jgi:cell division protein FtsI/penicillin-binding protein 2
MKPLSDMTKVALAAASYGYGIGVSPLQVIGAYSAIANGGTLWEPTLMKDGHKPVKVRRVISEKTAQTLREMLSGVVERGTGTPAQIPGYAAAGKTGTSRQLEPGTRKYSTTRYNASFVGFLPAEKPRWTILAVLQNPKGQYYGAQVAAPVFARLGKRLLSLEGVAPTRPIVVAGRQSRGPGR